VSERLLRILPRALRPVFAVPGGAVADPPLPAPVDAPPPAERPEPPRVGPTPAPAPTARRAMRA